MKLSSIADYNRWVLCGVISKEHYQYHRNHGTIYDNRGSMDRRVGRNRSAIFNLFSVRFENIWKYGINDFLKIFGQSLRVYEISWSCSVSVCRSLVQINSTFQLVPLRPKAQNYSGNDFTATANQTWNNQSEVSVYISDYFLFINLWSHL